MLLKVERALRLRGETEISGDKSISHRALMLGALAEGESTVSGFLPSDDCLQTLKALRALGVKIEALDSTNLVVSGAGLRGFREPDDVLDAGNSGTTLRILSGILAGQGFFSVLTGDDSLRKRPMDRIILPLRKMGAEIWAREDKFAPLAFHGKNGKGAALKGISYTTPVPSAQVKSAILLAGLSASGQTTVTEEHLSRDHTERMLKFLGAEIKINGTTTAVSGAETLSGQKIDIPGDLSSAMFLIVGALIVPNSEILLKNVGLNPTRIGALKVLKEMGAQIEEENIEERSNEPRADIRVKSSELQALSIGKELVPQLIDELPVLAVAATQAQGKTEIRGAQELRVKESDRIAAVKKELGKLGADVTEFPDGFSISGPVPLKGSVCHSHQDHRIAMALAVAGLVAAGETSIEAAECIPISFPGFEKTLKSLIK